MRVSVYVLYIVWARNRLADDVMVSENNQVDVR